MKRILVILSICFLFTGCAGKSKQEIGGEIGTAVGMLAGVGLAVIAGEDGMDAGMQLGFVAGSILGGMIGSAIGEYMDDVDRMKAEMAALTALKAEDKTPVKWSSEENEGVSGQAQVIRESNKFSRECKTVKHILNLNGKEIFEEQTYCLDSSGSWELQSS